MLQNEHNYPSFIDLKIRQKLTTMVIRLLIVLSQDGFLRRYRIIWFRALDSVPIWRRGEPSSLQSEWPPLLARGGFVVLRGSRGGGRGVTVGVHWYGTRTTHHRVLRSLLLDDHGNSRDFIQIDTIWESDVYQDFKTRENGHTVGSREISEACAVDDDWWLDTEMQNMLQEILVK